MKLLLNLSAKRGVTDKYLKSSILTSKNVRMNIYPYFCDDVVLVRPPSISIKWKMLYPVDEPAALH